MARVPDNKAHVVLPSKFEGRNYILRAPGIDGISHVIAQGAGLARSLERVAALVGEQGRHDGG